MTALDVAAYIAAVAAHPPLPSTSPTNSSPLGCVIPLTANIELWHEAVAPGHEVLWAATYGHACADSHAGRPEGTSPLAVFRRFLRLTHNEYRGFSSQGCGGCGGVEFEPDGGVVAVLNGAPPGS